MSAYRRLAFGAALGLAGAMLLLLLPSAVTLAPGTFLACGIVCGTVFAAFLGERPLGAGSSLIWALGFAFLTWVVSCAAAAFGTRTGDTSTMMLDIARSRFTVLVSLVVVSAPIGLVLGIATPVHATGVRRFSISRAVCAGGFAGVFGGWAFGKWMEQAGFFPLVAGLMRSEQTPSASRCTSRLRSCSA